MVGSGQSAVGSRQWAVFSVRLYRENAAAPAYGPSLAERARRAFALTTPDGPAFVRREGVLAFLRNRKRLFECAQGLVGLDK